MNIRCHVTSEEGRATSPRVATSSGLQDGRATKLAEFLGLLKPQSKSQTFVNESSQAVAAVPVPVLDIGGDVEPTEAHSEDTSASPVDAEIDPIVVDDDISDMEYLKSRMRSMQNAGGSYTQDGHARYPEMMTFENQNVFMQGLSQGPQRTTLPKQSLPLCMR